MWTNDYGPIVAESLRNQLIPIKVNSFNVEKVVMISFAFNGTHRK
jgi:hypothetical protein